MENIIIQKKFLKANKKVCLTLSITFIFISFLMVFHILSVQPRFEGIQDVGVNHVLINGILISNKYTVKEANVEIFVIDKEGNVLKTYERFFNQETKIIVNEYIYEGNPFRVSFIYSNIKINTYGNTLISIFCFLISVYFSTQFFLLKKRLKSFE